MKKELFNLLRSRGYDCYYSGKNQLMYITPIHEDDTNTKQDVLNLAEGYNIKYLSDER